MKYLFVGEKRSQKAIKMNVRWKDGNLAAKQLFDALDSCKIDKKQCTFVNWFEPMRQQGFIFTKQYFFQLAVEQNYKIIAMGRKVEKELVRKKIPHIYIVHPAARGAIRKKNRYAKHLKDKLV